MFVGCNLVPCVDQAILSAADLHIGIGRYGHYRNTNAQLLCLGSLRFVDCGFGSAPQTTKQVEFPSSGQAQIEVTLIAFIGGGRPSKPSGRALKRLPKGVGLSGQRSRGLKPSSASPAAARACSTRVNAAARSRF